MHDDDAEDSPGDLPADPRSTGDPPRSSPSAVPAHGTAAFIADNWNVLAQAGIAVMAAVGKLIFSPPDIDDKPSWLSFARYAMAVLVALWLLPMRRWNRRAHARRWWIAAAVGLPLALGAAIWYGDFRDRSILHYRGRSIVISDTLTMDARTYRDSIVTATHQPFPPDELLGDYAGDVDAVWPKADTERRQLLLVIAYLCVAAVVASELIIAVQATYTATHDDG